MEAKVAAIAFVLLLLTFEKCAFATTADQVTQNDGGAPPASQEDDFGVSAYAVNWKPPASPEDDFDVSAYAVNWKPPASPEDGFDVSAYAVNWKSPASPEDHFDVSAYAVNWKPPPSPSQEDDFGVSAYAVNWSPPASQEDDFGVSAYAVNWSPPASQEDDFGASAYAVNLSPPASQKEDFGVSSYAVNWSPPASHSLVPEAPARRQHIKVQTGMLFLKKNLHVGTVLPEGTTFARARLPKSDSSAFTPLEPKYFAAILSRFKIPHNSMKAKQVTDTLRSCVVKPGDKEEPHMCFSSREAMTRFATRALGGASRPARAAIARIHGHETSSSRYLVAQITQLSNNTVACHPMDFPYEVYYCHRPKEVHSLRVQLEDVQNGMPRVTTTVMCHMNTSNWDTWYFELLGGEHGEPICHYMPQNYIMFY